jgi:hypothetical protein
MQEFVLIVSKTVSACISCGLFTEWYVHTLCLYPMMIGMSTHLVNIQWWLACPHILFISSDEWHVHTLCLYPMMIGMSTHLVYIQNEPSELGALLLHGPREIRVSLSAFTVHDAWPRISGILVVLSALHFEVHSVIGSY